MWEGGGLESRRGDEKRVEERRGEQMVIIKELPNGKAQNVVKSAKRIVPEHV